MTYRYFLKLAFNGQNFNGWQIQPNGKSVQEEIEKVLNWIHGEKTRIHGAGRTDTGVHALEMFAHFDIDTILTVDKESWLNEINSKLPDGIVINDLLKAKAGSHARFDAISRTYKYIINRSKDPFNQDFSWFWRGNLDIDRMNSGAKLLLGEHDFKSFSKVHTDVSNYRCNVTSAQWTEEGSKLVFTITANRFLRNMVRAIVGTLFEMGRGKSDEDGLRSILEKRDRRVAGMSVPAKGLFLAKIEYPEGVFEVDR